jgi:hypothetical protein
MTPAERNALRQIALGAVRSELRRQGVDPQTVSAESAYAVVDNLYRTDPQLLVSIWYDKASQAERNWFIKEWGKENANGY